MVISNIRRVMYPICAIIGFSLLLAGCASQQPKQAEGPQFVPWHKRHESLSQIHSWHIKGAASINYDNNSQFVHFDWQQKDARHYRITISGPMYMGGATIQGEPGKITLSQGGKQQVASTPEALMLDQFGWYLPLSQLQAWIKGMPASGTLTHKKLDDYGRLAMLQQGGWRLKYQGYHIKHDQDLPKTLRLKNGPLKAKLVIQQWGIYSQKGHSSGQPNRTSTNH